MQQLFFIRGKNRNTPSRKGWGWGAAAHLQCMGGLRYLNKQINVLKKAAGITRVFSFVAASNRVQILLFVVFRC